MKTRIQTKVIEGKVYVPVRCEVWEEDGAEHETINLIEVGVLIRELEKWKR